MQLKGKKALVTGASRGIGKEIVAAFLREGATVWGISTKPSPHHDELTALAAETGATLHWELADVSQEESITAVTEKILAEAGGIDILVNNAGITRDGLSFRMSTQDWSDVLAVNLNGAFFISRLVARQMTRQKSGSIINMSSIVGVHGNAGQCNYSASKAGLIGLTKSLAYEVGSRGIRVNAIAPGFIDTEMTSSLSETIKTGLNERIPMKRMGTAAEIADSVVFLASDKSTYITGHVLAVDGGMGM